MDWTGGTRRRFAPKKSNATIQRQKAYFARARAALNAAVPQPPSQTAIIHSEAGSKQSIADCRYLVDDHPRRPTNDDLKPWKPISNATNDPAHHNVPADSRQRIQISNNRSSEADVAHSSDHPRPTSLKQHTRVMAGQGSHRHKIPPTDGTNEEETLLRANRRRLLDRSDWLGLASARPLSYRAPSFHDKDRIGKRRRIDKPKSKRTEPADQRILTPVFEENLQQQALLMRGALSPDNLQIKIGTDALVTQTRYSRHSHTPAKTSMRPPSTDFGPLSEESMLLEADEVNSELFKALHHPRELQELASYPLQDEHPGIDLQQHESQLADYSPVSTSNSSDVHVPRPDVNDQSSKQTISSSNYLEHAMERHPQEVIRPMGRENRPGGNATPNYDQQAYLPSYVQHAVLTTEDDNEIWTRFVNVAQHISSNSSTMALKSSSRHITSSESHQPPVLVQENRLDQGTSQKISTPFGVRSHPPNMSDRLRSTNPGIETENGPKLASPSNSLKRITHLAAQPGQHEASKQQQEDDVLWREFVCGDYDKSDTSSQILLADCREQNPTAKKLALAPASFSYMVSDLGTSNKTTIGGDTYVAEGSLSMPSMQQEQRLDFDLDSIEDEDDTYVPDRPSRNIHATRTRALNPKRFLPPQQRQTAMKRPSNLLSSHKSQGKVPKLEKSVYDLLDSEGNSNK